MWLLLCAAVARGQAPIVDRFDGNQFRPSPDSPTTLWTEQSSGGPDGMMSARAYLHYAAAPVRWRTADGETVRLVGDQVGMDLAAGYRWRGLRLGAHLPLYAWTAGEGSADQPGLGDLSFDLKGTLLDRSESPVGLALQGRLLLPTASVEVPLGTTGTGWELVGVVDHQQGDLTLVANLGLQGVDRAEYRDLVWDDGVFVRLGGGYALRPDAGASLELSARTNWASARNPAGTAAELLAGGWASVRSDLVVRGGVSTGLSRSPGAPLARLVAGLSWEPDPNPDRDVDGLVDRDDWCPDLPEDPDGFEDGDGCPDDAVTARLDLRGPDGAPVEASVVLDGAERHELATGDAFVTLHPGTYRARVDAPGFLPFEGDLRFEASQGQHVPVALVPDTGAIRLWAVDLAGEPVDAAFRLADGTALPADGTPIALPVGEQALVIVAPGYRARALSVEVSSGRTREVPVVLEPAKPGDPIDPTTGDGGASL